ncbi:MAG: BACON domain-containing carbohydrate-binding protein [Oscillospiraceae bacterium]|nr:BACON domain-containing carbohydrate-binding protein [Oscillospiraceae bacterium]
MTESSTWITIGKSSLYVFQIKVSENTGNERSAVVKLVDGSNTTYITVKQAVGRYTLTYRNNTGSGGPGTVSVIPGNTIQISYNSPSKMYCVFAGWATSQLNANAGVVSYRPGSYITVKSNVSLYAVWNIDSNMKNTVVTNAKGQNINRQLLIEVMEASRPTTNSHLQKFYETLPIYYPLPYGQYSYHVKSDCGGLARGIYQDVLGYTLSVNGYGGTQTWTNPDTGVTSTGRTTNSMFTATSGTIGTIIFNSPFVQGGVPVSGRQTLNLAILKPGDVLFYDYGPDSKPEGTIDHVAIYVGKTADGRHVLIETCSTSNPVHFEVLDNASATSIVGVKRYFSAF